MLSPLIITALEIMPGDLFDVFVTWVEHSAVAITDGPDNERRDYSGMISTGKSVGPENRSFPNATFQHFPRNELKYPPSGWEVLDQGLATDGTWGGVR